jgi:hypothetical protein
MPAWRLAFRMALGYFSQRHKKGHMGARKTNINPICWAVTGTYEGLKYDGINVTPLLDKERILFTITTDTGELKTFAEVPFPAKDQTEEKFTHIMKGVVGKQLMILL